MRPISSYLPSLPDQSVTNEFFKKVTSNSVLGIAGAYVLSDKTKTLGANCVFGVICQQIIARSLRNPVNQVLDQIEKRLPQRVKNLIPDSVSKNPLVGLASNAARFATPFILGELAVNSIGMEAPFYLPVLGFVPVLGATVIGYFAVASLYESYPTTQQTNPTPVNPPKATNNAESKEPEIKLVKTPLNSDNFAEKVLQDKGVVMIYTYAEKLNEDEMLYAVIKQHRKLDPRDKSCEVAQLDVAKNEELAKEYNIGTQPSILIFKDGQLISTKIINSPKKLEVA